MKFMVFLAFCLFGMVSKPVLAVTDSAHAPNAQVLNSGSNPIELDGFINGNNGDFFPHNYPQIFDSLKKVNYCIETGPNASFQAEEISQALMSATNKWADFLKIQNHFMKSPSKPLYHRMEIRSLLESLPEYFINSLNFSFVATCSDPSVNLKVLFGADSPQTAKHRAQFRNTPVAFVLADKATNQKAELWIGSDDQIKENFNSEAVLSEGVRWTSNKLEAVFMHELGHIIGLPHEANEIMQSDFPYRVYLHNLHYDAPSVSDLIDSTFFAFAQYCSGQFQVTEGELSDIVPAGFFLDQSIRICVRRPLQAAAEAYEIIIQKVNKDGYTHRWEDIHVLEFEHVDNNVSLHPTKLDLTLTPSETHSNLKSSLSMQIVKEYWQILNSSSADMLLTIKRDNFGKSANMMFTTGLSSPGLRKKVKIHVENFKNSMGVVK